MVFLPTTTTTTTKKKREEVTNTLALTHTITLRRRYTCVCISFFLLRGCIVQVQIQCDDDVFQCYCLMHNNDATLLLFVACKQNYTHSQEFFLSLHARSFFCLCVVLCYSQYWMPKPYDWCCSIYTHSHWLRVIACAYVCACVFVCMSAFCFVLCSVSKRTTAFEAENEIASVISHEVHTQCVSTDSATVSARWIRIEISTNK